MKIKDILRRKGDAVVTVTPDQTVRELLGLLLEHRVGALVVSDQAGTVDGIVSERDIVRRLSTHGAEVLDLAVTAIMTTPVHTCLPDQSCEELMELMTEHRVRHVPVVVEGQLAGIVSIGDVVKTRLQELQGERDQLTAYITG